MTRIGACGAACTFSLLLAAAVSLGSGCAVQVPEGRFRCTSSAECPSGWTCRAQHCFSTSDGADAATDAPVDASVVDAPSVDAARDADPVDTGPDDAAPLDASDDAASAPDAGADAGPTCGAVSSSPTLAHLVAYGSAGSDDVTGLARSRATRSVVLPLSFGGASLSIGATSLDNTGGLDSAAIRARSDGTAQSTTAFTGAMDQQLADAIESDGVVLTTGSFTGTMTGPVTLTGGSNDLGFVVVEGGGAIVLPSTSFTRPSAIDAAGDVVCVGGQFGGITTFNGAASITARGSDGFVACYDRTSLAHVYSVGFGGSTDDDRVADLALSPDGQTLFIAGVVNSAAAALHGVTLASRGTYGDAFVGRIDDFRTAPRLTWSQLIGTGDTARTERATAVLLAGSEVYVGGWVGAGSVRGVGSSGYMPSGYAGFYARYDAATGAASWVRYVDDGGGDEVWSLATDGCGRFFVGGGRNASVTPTRTTTTPFVISFDASGTERWSVTATGGLGAVTALVAQDDGTVQAVGPFAGNLRFSPTLTVPTARGAADVFLLDVTQ